MNAKKWIFRLWAIFLAICSFGVLIAQDCDDVTMLELSIGGEFVENGAVIDVAGQNIPYISVAVTLDDITLNQECDEDFVYLGFLWGDNTTLSCKVTLPSPLPLVSHHLVDVTCIGNGTLEDVSTSLEVTLVNLPAVVIQSGECMGNSIRLSVPEIVDAQGWSFSWTREAFNEVVNDENFIVVDLPDEGEVDNWVVCVSYEGELIGCSMVLALDGSEIRPSISLTPSNPEDWMVCQNGDLEFTISSSGEQSFEWVRRSAPSTVLFTTPTVSLPAGNYTVRTTGAGCPASEDFDVSVIPGPGLPSLTGGSATEVCPGLTGMVEVNAVGGLTYRWETTNGELLDTGTSFSSGPDTFRVVAMNAEGCTSSLMVEIAQSSAHNPSIIPSSQPPYCEGEVITLMAENLGDATATWSTNVTGAAIDIDVGGEYSVTYSGGTMCDNSSSTNIPAFGEPPSLPAQSDQSILAGELATIQVLLGAAASVTVLLDSIETMNATLSGLSVSEQGVISFVAGGTAGARATGAIRFTLIPESAEGCVGPSQTLLVRVVPDVEAPFIPEIISPNGDGSNDEWSVVFPEDGADYDVVVYSRGGAVVFEGSGSQMPWDAGPCPNGVYYYRITQRGPEGGQWQGALTIIGRQGR
jgi:gliding motility-associated-like protein